MPDLKTAPLAMRFRWSRPGLATVFFLLSISVVSARPYFYSLYDMDMLGYMGNAVAISGASIQQIHETVYQEVLTLVPQPTRNHLLGRDGVGPTSRINSARDRSTNAYHFAEFLPCFAIRPLFNETVYLLHYKLGLSLVRATVVIPVFSYWLLGILVFFWMSSYVGGVLAASLSLLLMLCPPILNLARFNTPDALSCLFVMASLYLILERGNIFWGLVLLLSSVYVRTDNVLLVVAVLTYCTFSSRLISKTQGFVLAAVAVSSVVVINHFSGDYGIRVLFYRSFVEVPNAPGELVAKFGLKDYLIAFRTGVSEVFNSYFFPFTLIGALGLLLQRRRAAVSLAVLVSAYCCLHFLLFPSGQERFWGPYYLAMGLIAGMALRLRAHSETEKLDSRQGSAYKLAV